MFDPTRACRCPGDPGACGLQLDAAARERYSASMRFIGRPLPELAPTPTAAALRRAAVHQAGGRALAAVSSTGIVKGVYRFKSQAEADAQVEDALARVMAANAALHRRAE